MDKPYIVADYQEYNGEWYWNIYYSHESGKGMRVYATCGTFKDVVWYAKELITMVSHLAKDTVFFIDDHETIEYKRLDLNDDTEVVQAILTYS